MQRSDYNTLKDALNNSSLREFCLLTDLGFVNFDLLSTDKGLVFVNYKDEYNYMGIEDICDPLKNKLIDS